MIKIEFLDQEIQDIIYRIAHKYEGFDVLDENDILNSFYKNIEMNSECEFGLEKAISDYLLFENDFSKNGKYHYIIDRYQGENRIIKNIEIINNDKDNKPKEQKLRDMMNADFWN